MSDDEPPSTLDEHPPPAPGAPPARISRRALLAGAGTLGAGIALGAGAEAALRRSSSPPGAEQLVPFHGEHQAGIATPAQDRLAFGALDVVAGTSRGELRDLLRTWSEAAEKLTRGELVGEERDPSAPPLDTGEAVGSPVGRLTITLGLGPSLFDARFGLATRRPRALGVLPPLPNEELDPDYCGGDLCLQACSDDPLVAFHAVRNLARLGMGVVEHRWMELGFGRTSTTSAAQTTPRNLLGFKDGTRNIRSEQTELMDRYVWVGRESEQPWLRGGSYLVARRIRIFIENWDRDYLQDQQNTIGRFKASGAPLTGGGELTPPDFRAAGESGPVIPERAHIRLAAHEQNGGLRLLRRGYSYTDGIDPVRGTLLGGLFFIAFMQDPRQFVALQRKLGAEDALGEYVQHTGSALFACPPGVRQGEHWGQGLLG